MTDPIKARMKLEDSELWLQLGKEVSPGLGARDPKFLIAAAKAWFDSRLEQIRAAVCGNKVIARARESEDQTVLVTAVFDVISPLLGAVPAATAAVLVVRYGLDRLCGTALVK